MSRDLIVSESGSLVPLDSATLKPLETLVNKAIRIMSFAPVGNIDLSQVYKDFYLLNLSNVHTLEIGKFIFKEKLGYLPTRIGNYFPTSSNFTTHNYGTRISSSTIPSNININYRLKSSEKSVQFKCDVFWSNLQDSFKSLETVNIFKKHYKKFLISGQWKFEHPLHYHWNYLIEKLPCFWLVTEPTKLI